MINIRKLELFLKSILILTYLLIALISFSILGTIAIIVWRILK